MDKPEHAGTADGDRGTPPAVGSWIGLRGRLARPFWGWLGSWAVVCGALASNGLRWQGGQLIDLVLALLLVELAWGSLWDLAVGTDWFRSLAASWPPAQPATLPTLPYTRPGSPGGRLVRWLSRLAGWWCEAFWPVAGAALLGLLAAAILTAVLALLLPDRLRPLQAALLALTALGVIQRRRGREPLAGQAFVRVGLSWLAGHALFADLGLASWILALSFALAAWGNLRLAAGLGRGLWLLNGGQVIGFVVLVGVQQPLAAGVAGLLLFGQLAMQPSLRYSTPAVPATISTRTWPWMMAAMLVTGWALP